MNFPPQHRLKKQGRHSVPNQGVPPVSRWLLEWFVRYSDFYLRRHFSGIWLSGNQPQFTAAGPWVVYLNHGSWWDPLICLRASHRFSWRLPNFAPIDQDALKRFGFFKRLGFFGVEKGTARGAVRFLEQAEALLENPRTVLWITPQGDFVDQRQRPVLLKRGLLHLAKRVPEASFVPLAIDYFFGRERLPAAGLRFGQTFRPSSLHELEMALEETMDQLAADVLSRNILKSAPLAAGRLGTGGVYGFWQRLKGA